jgi:hypothetical protein
VLVVKFVVELEEPLVSAWLVLMVVEVLQTV